MLTPMLVAGIDLGLAEHANRFAQQHDGWEDPARLYAQISEPLFLLLVALLVIGGFALRRPRLLVTGLLAGLSSAVALLVAYGISALVDRPRPFVAHHEIHAFLVHAPDPGFPSDHSTAAFAIAGVLVYRYGLRAIPVLVAAAALAVSRVVIGLHYPSDVLAGAVIGLLVATGVGVLADRPGATGGTTAVLRRWPWLRQVVGA